MRNRSPGRRSASLLLLALCLTLVLPAAAADPWFKLSGPMQPGGDVEGFEISPDSRYVVYTADQEIEDVFDLYSVPSGGGVPVRLSDLRAAAGDPERVDSYAISPDSSRVVFVADLDEGGVLELYSVPITGTHSAVVKLNKPLVEDADLWDFTISPDSKTVIYSADQEKFRRNEIYAVPIAGPAGAGIKLNAPVVNGGSLYAATISPDGQRVLYRGDQDKDEVEELYSVPISRSAPPVKLNKTLVGGGSVGRYAIDPTSQHVVYKANQDAENREELYTVPIAGPASAGKKISAANMAYGVWSFVVSADGQRVVYDARQETISTLELYSVPILGPGSAVVKLNIPLPLGRGVFMYEVSADSRSVIYRADPSAEYDYELFSVPIAGPAGANVKLNRALAADGDVNRFTVSADSARVVYTAELQGSPTNELYSVPIAGPAASAVKLNGPLVAGGKAWYSELSPDAGEVVYLADANTVGVDELFSVPIAGPAGAAERISGVMAAGGDVWDAWYSPDSRSVVYMAEQQSATNVELYAVGARPAGGRVRYLPLVVRRR